MGQEEDVEDLVGEELFKYAQVASAESESQLPNHGVWDHSKKPRGEWISR